MEFVFAFLVSVGLVGIFSKIYRRAGAWASVWMFFLIVLLGTWAVGLWVQPFGPQLLGVAWLPFFLTGLVLCLLLAASIPEAVTGSDGAASHVPRTRTDEPAAPGEKTVAPRRSDETSASSRVTSDDVIREQRVMNRLLWVLLALLGSVVGLGLYIRAVS